VWGKEAVQFLDGMISNDMKTLEDGQQMLAAFPNAQGRLLAVARILRQGDRFLIDTEEATREKVFNNLFRFTYAGDFFVEDLSEQYRYFEMFPGTQAPSPASPHRGEDDAATRSVRFSSVRSGSATLAIPSNDVDRLPVGMLGEVEISDEIYETLRIESGIPKYGVDMDETTIVPELGLDGLISYNKGCYIGQEIIARIHFRGHVAKRLTGLIFNGDLGLAADAGGTPAFRPTELTALDGKPAGRITSITYSPKLEKTIALAYVRYDYLAEGTELRVGEVSATVKDLPFVQ
ncbi:MAG TPA: glycine cleavage T C-terminal barrel domain-containing protein, partial [Pyrinomonadaceae bacterium]|nr:glycine cleavage T C-terminal barrel domain-containing protein [Pyrinomonadaceae bacterium]